MHDNFPNHLILLILLILFYLLVLLTYRGRETDTLTYVIVNALLTSRC